MNSRSALRASLEDYTKLTISVINFPFFEKITSIIMPPKKAKLSWEQSLSLIHQHKIEFKGCVPPREWPARYQHHFRKIREISGNRCEDYGLEETGERRFIGEQKQRARELARSSYTLRDEIKTNESSWRELESSIFYRFDGDVVWSAPDSRIRTRS